MTTRLKLTVAYDGGPYAGWQSQAGGDGVQDHIEKALTTIVGLPVRVHGSGRTDAGVHALAQIAHADVPAGKHTNARWLAALNANLPHAIRVTRVTRVDGGREGFHARYSAKGKRYEYRIYNAAWLHPLEMGRAWHVAQPLDISAMREAAALFVGRHDFASFAANRGDAGVDTVRTLKRVAITRRGSLVTLVFEGDGFLYKMVRMLTGTLVRIGQGKADARLVRELLARRGRTKTQFAAPAEGLYLARVCYA